jgi:hypothetical protein
MSHLDLDVLADVLVGVVQPEHLSTCVSCQERLEQLSAAQGTVFAALAAVPTPPIPAELIARLDAALALERAPKVAAATVTPLSAARSRRTPWLAWAGGIAAASALVVGGLTLRSGGSSSSSNGALGSAAGLRTNSTGNDYSTKGPLLAQSLPGLLAGTSAKAAAGSAGGAPELNSVPAPAGGTTGGGQAPPATTVLRPDALAALHVPAALAACLAGLTDPGDSTLPLALDYASFDGEPALVVVYPATKPGKVDVFVVGAGCTQADSKLLFFARLARP